MGILHRKNEQMAKEVHELAPLLYGVFQDPSPKGIQVLYQYQIQVVKSVIFKLHSGFHYLHFKLHSGFHYLLTVTYIPTNQENWPNVGTIASTLAQYSAIYGNTLGQCS